MESKVLEENVTKDEDSPERLLPKEQEPSGVQEGFVYGTEARKDFLEFDHQGEYTLEDYYALPEDVRAELIDGTFFIMEAPTTYHQEILGEVGWQIKNFFKKNKGNCKVFTSPVDVRLDCDDRTMVQPDVVILCDRSKLHHWGIMGAPDFVMEVLSPSTKRKDCIKKLAKYEAAGVKEYWILDPKDRNLAVYRFEEKGENAVAIYGLEGQVPVGLYQGQLVIDLDAIAELLRDYEE